MALKPSEVAAVLVTRGNVDLNPILAELPFDEVVVWNNADRDDVAVYGRYAGIAETYQPWIYVQDDDCLLPRASILALLEGTEWGHITANVPAAHRANYPDSCLVGFGAVFQRHLPAAAHARYQAGGPFGSADPTFLRTCDVPFTVLTPRLLYEVPFRHLRQAFDDDRMCRQPGHEQERDLALARARRIRDAAPSASLLADDPDPEVPT